MNTITITWSTKDILAKADELNIEITEKQADRLLDLIKHYHDAYIGINWQVIEEYLFSFEKLAAIDFTLN